MKNHLPKLLASIALCELVGLLGTPFTIAAIPTWYASLVKPAFSPPNWLFGPVWTFLYFLMGIAFFLIWKLGWKKRRVRTAELFFLIQLALNFLWPLAFFGLRVPLLGLLTILMLWGLILMTMKQFYSLSKTAFSLLIPYLLWVSFAAVLNAAIVALN